MRLRARVKSRASQTAFLRLAAPVKVDAYTRMGVC